MGTCAINKKLNCMIIEMIHNVNQNTNRICLICQKQIHDEIFTKCVVCNINYHRICLDNWIDKTTKTYCKCCHCQSIGTLIISCQ